MLSPKGDPVRARNGYRPRWRCPRYTCMLVGGVLPVLPKGYTIQPKSDMDPTTVPTSNYKSRYTVSINYILSLAIFIIAGEEKSKSNSSSEGKFYIARFIVVRIAVSNETNKKYNVTY